ncbi:MAG: hypothetical protein U1E73_03700 [Planctomycetota bacterium]
MGRGVVPRARRPHGALPARDRAPARRPRTRAAALRGPRAGPARHAGRLFGFLGLESTAEVESFLGDGANDLFQRHGTSTSPAASIGRWATDFTAEQCRIAAAALGDELRRLGYSA